MVDGRSRRRASIDATLIKDFPYDQLADVERSWGRARRKVAAGLAARGLDLESGHWDWKNKLRAAYSKEHRLFAVECKGRVQGLMTLETTPRPALLGHGSRLIYVDFVESAPWNLLLPDQTPRFFGVGTVLIGEAVRESLSLGHEGRIGLHSLPQAERFYLKRCRMSLLRLDPSYHDLAYFEYLDGVAGLWLADNGLDS